jgi:hypothetical protein
MKIRRTLRPWAAVCVLSLPLIAACGGGGGGGGGDNRVPYAGKVTQATITRDNADIVAGGVGAGLPMTLGFTGPGGLFKASAQRGEPHRFSVTEVGRLLQNRVEGAFGGADPRVRRQAASSQSESIPGSCGGQANVSLDLNQSTGGFTGSLDFTPDFCDEGVKMAGGMSVTGQMDRATQGIVRMDLSFDRLDIKDPTDPYAADLSMTGTMSLDVPTNAVTVSAVFRDNIAQKTLKFEAFRVACTTNGDSTSATVTGRFYEPADGYVEFMTDAPLVLASGASNPSAGMVTALGANRTKSRLTALTQTTCRIDADLNGDGDYGDAGEDYDSGEVNWSDL